MEEKITEVWMFPFGKITIHGSINPNWSHLYCTSQEEYDKIVAERTKKEPQVEAEEAWRPSKKAVGVIISNIAPAKASDERTAEENQYYGGWLICESIRSKKDLALIAQAPEMLRILKRLISSEKQKYDAEYIDLVISKAEGNEK